jgi:hypothetical protein
MTKLLGNVFLRRWGSLLLVSDISGALLDIFGEFRVALSSKLIKTRCRCPHEQRGEFIQLIRWIFIVGSNAQERSLSISSKCSKRFLFSFKCSFLTWLLPYCCDCKGDAPVELPSPDEGPQAHRYRDLRAQQGVQAALEVEYEILRILYRTEA